MSTPEFDDADRGEADSEGGRSGTSRRRLLVGGAATWATVSLAGCPSGDGGTETTTTTAEPTTTTTTTTEEPTTTTTPEPQPEDYVVTIETATGSEAVPESAGFVSACSPTRRFTPGMQVIFYVGIFDPETGDQLTNDDLSSVVVNVDGGPEVELQWAGDDEEHPAQEWGGSYVLSEDVEPGTYTYTVEVTDGEANFRTVGILEDSFDVIEYSDPTNYVVTNHTYAISSPDASNGFVGACGPERQFTADMTVGFLVGVYDTANGEIVGNDTLDSVTIEFPEMSWDPVELQWAGDDEEHAADEWTGSMELPSDVEPGTYQYTVNVTNAADNIWQVGIAANQFTIIEV